MRLFPSILLAASTACVLDLGAHCPEIPRVEMNYPRRLPLVIGLPAGDYPWGPYDLRGRTSWPRGSPWMAKDP